MMQSETKSECDSSLLSKIFETSGLTQIASTELPEKKRHKWMVRCNNCNGPITQKQALMHNVIYSLNKIWHREHFTCIRCKCLVGHNERPFRKYRSDRNQPICIDCYMEEYHPKCNACSKALRETCVKAMYKLWHRCCFTCTKCHSPFVGGEFIIYNDKPYDIDCYYLTKYANELTPAINCQVGFITESSEIDQKIAIEQISTKTTQQSSDTILSTIQSTEERKYPLSMIPLPVSSKPDFNSEKLKPHHLL